MWTLVLGKLFGIGETWVEAKTKQATAKVENQIALDQATTQAAITVKQKDADATNDIDLISVIPATFRVWITLVLSTSFLNPVIPLQKLIKGDMPDLIFLDEPTSGLDGTSTLEILQILRTLANNGGKTIILTIHQPRIEAYKLVDNLILLVNGIITKRLVVA